MNQTRTPSRGPRFAPLIRIFNLIPRALLQSPLHSLMDGRFILLGFTGRKSGRPFRVPVAYIELEGTLLVGAGAPWVKNLSSGVPIVVWYRGRRQAAVPEIVRDPDEFTRLARIMSASNPVWGRFQGINRDPDGQIDPDQLEQARRRGAIMLRLRLK